nr:reverse transcriptase domain-containing protein [Tanacetum cinerariifolium]
MQQPSGSGSLPSNTIANPRSYLKVITTRSVIAYDGPTILPTPSPLQKEAERETEATKDKTNPKPSIPYPLRLNDQKFREKTNNQVLKFFQIFQRLHFDISFVDALLHKPKFASSFKSLLRNKEKSFELASTPLNKNCSAMLLKKFPKKLQDPEALAPKMPLRVNDDAITFKVGHTSRYSRNSYDEMVHQVNVINDACKEYAQEVLRFSHSSTSGNPIPSNPIIASSSPLFTPFEGNDFILEEIETFLHPFPNLPPVKNEDLKQVDPTMTKPSIEEPSVLELNDLPSHIEYAFLEGNDKLHVIISKELKDEEKSALLKVLKSYKRAIAWKISDIKVIDPRFCTHKILIEDDFKLKVQHQRSPWVSPVHCVPKKGGMTVIENEDNEINTSSISYGMAFASDWDLPFEIMCDAGDYVVGAVLGQWMSSTAYHPQTSRQVEVSNPGLKRILERTVGENRASWFDKLHDALWAFRTTFKTPIGCTPYKLVYGKACHLPIEQEHKAYQALKHCNFDLKTAGDHLKVQMNELNELRDQSYENSLIYKEKTKKIHDYKIKNRVFNVGD